MTYSLKQGTLQGMETLVPYSVNTTGIILLGNVERVDTRTIRLIFSVADTQSSLIHGPAGITAYYEGNHLTRAHELWKDTCFEFFWAEKGSDAYYECNTNVFGKWNVYRFEAYRNPMPPQETDEYAMIRIAVEGNTVMVTLVCVHDIPSKLSCTLTAVLNTKEGELYYALAHKGTQPDFHVRESFVKQL